MVIDVDPDVVGEVRCHGVEEFVGGAVFNGGLAEFHVVVYGRWVAFRARDIDVFVVVLVVGDDADDGVGFLKGEFEAPFVESVGVGVWQ